MVVVLDVVGFVDLKLCGVIAVIGYVYSFFNSLDEY